jgi:hypothetical protein
MRDERSRISEEPSASVAESLRKKPPRGSERISRNKYAKTVRSVDCLFERREKRAEPTTARLLHGHLLRKERVEEPVRGDTCVITARLLDVKKSVLRCDH